MSLCVQHFRTFICLFQTFLSPESVLYHQLKLARKPKKSELKTNNSKRNEKNNEILRISYFYHLPVNSLIFTIVLVNFNPCHFYVGQPLFPFKFSIQDDRESEIPSPNSKTKFRPNLILVLILFLGLVYY